MGTKKRIYRFDKKSGEMVDVTPIADVATVQLLERDTKRVRKGLKPRGVQRTGGYPYESEVMAVDPEDIGTAQDILAKRGVQTDYTPTGEPIIRSPEHRRQHAKAMGFYDRNGTWSPDNR